MPINLDAVQANLERDGRLDAGESAFFLRQLEHIMPEVYMVEHVELKARQLLPVDSSAPAGTRTITWRMWDRIGVARIISDYTRELPKVALYGNEQSVKVRDIGVGYSYSIPEIQSARLANVSLDVEYALAARRASEELLDRIAWQGDAKTGLKGLIGYAGVSEYTVPADGTGSSKLWTTKTPTQILRDLAGMTTAVRVPTKSRETPDTIVLPLAAYDYIAQMPYSVNSDKTILRYYLDNNPFAMQVEWLDVLNYVGAGGVGRMYAYKKDPRKLKLHVPQDFTQLAPQLAGLNYEIPCLMSTGGLTIQYPLSVAFGDGITPAA